MRLTDFRFTFLIAALWWGELIGFQIVTGQFIGVTIFGILWVALFLKKSTLRNYLLISLLCFWLGAGLSSLKHFQIQSAELPTSGLVTFEVLEDMRATPARFGMAGEMEYQALVDGEFESANAEDSKLQTAPLLLSTSDSAMAQARISSKWKCAARITQQEQPRRYAGFAQCLEPPEPVAAANRLQLFADIFRHALRDVTSERFAADAAALLPGLVLGDTSAQSSQLENSLQLAGLGHLTAVSGANVAIILVAIELLLQRTRLSRKHRLVVLVIGALVFMFVARPSPSVVRATAMALFGLASLWLGFSKISLLLLNLAVLGLLVIDPFLSSAIGFTLSAFATFGLIVLPRVWGVSAADSFTWKAFSTALSAVLATLPVLVAAGLNPTFASVPANMFAEVMVAPATLAGVLAAVLQSLAGLPLGVGWIFHELAKLAADFGLLPAAVIVWIAQTANESIFQVAVQSRTGLLLVFGIGLLWFVLNRISFSNKRIAAVCVLLTIFVLSVETTSSKWSNNWDIAVCDVGQGDAAVIRISDNQAVLIDAGPDEVALLNCLRDLNITEVPFFIASHFHADHVAAVSVLKDFGVKKLWIAKSQSPLPMYEKVISELPEAEVLIPVVGDQVQYPDVKIQALQVPDGLVETDSGTAINDASLVVLVEINGKRILFTGDIETLAQTTLMQTYPELALSVVKVPHHGSASQNPDFASWSDAQLGWVSVGIDNSYGHPAPVTLSSYRAAGIRLYSTSLCGRIGLQLNPDSVGVISNKSCDAL
jgi:competence protein ComEC